MKPSPCYKAFTVEWGRQGQDWHIIIICYLPLQICQWQKIKSGRAGILLDFRWIRSEHLRSSGGFGTNFKSYRKCTHTVLFFFFFYQKVYLTLTTFLKPVLLWILGKPGPSELAFIFLKLVFSSFSCGDIRRKVCSQVYSQWQPLESFLQRKEEKERKLGIYGTWYIY